MSNTKKSSNWKVKTGKLKTIPVKGVTFEKLTRPKSSLGCNTKSKCVDVDKNYLHTQSTASLIWTIQHNLQKYPSVTIMSNSGQQVFADVEHTSKNELIITFSIPFAGTASMN